MPGTPMSSKEAAQQLGYTRQHVRRLIRNNELQGHKVGRDWVVEESSIERYLGSMQNHALDLNGVPAPDAPEVEVDGSDMSVTQIMSGGEATLDMKRRAKRLAWANGDRPEWTDHRVYRGDARVMKELAAESVHLIVTSPPYFDLIEYEASHATPGQIGNLDSYEAFLDQLDRVWQRALEVLVPGGRLCVVVGDVCVSRREAGRHHVLPLHADIAQRCRRIGFDYLTPILWSKIANMSTEVGGGSRFLGKPYEPNAIIKNDTEYILLLRKAGSYRKPTPVQRALSLIDQEDHRKWFRSVWTDIRGENRKAGHPAPYPVEIPFRLINMFSFVGDTVLDPFWGTGSTTAAAMKAARSSVGYEIERRYIEIGRERLSQIDATLVAPRLHFESVE